jgi:anti-sigma-K factor RskA
MSTETERLALEQVLGRPSAEDAAAISALAGDSAFAAEVAGWEDRLAPLAGIVTPVQPGEALWQRIATTTMQAPANSNVISLESAVAARTAQLSARLRRWRQATGAAGALAAGLALAMVLRPGALPTGTGQQFVGVVNTSGELPPLVVSVDLARGEFTVTPVDLKPRAGKDYELWAVPVNSKPVSLGVVAKADRRSIEALAQSKWRDPALVLAVSVEPTGGSTTGQPTGPVVYTGKLIEAP